VPDEIDAAVHDVEASGLDSIVDRVVAESGRAELAAGGHSMLPLGEPSGGINPVNVALVGSRPRCATFTGVVPVNCAPRALARMRATLTGFRAHLHPAS
jgi:hypothetical protein